MAERRCGSTVAGHLRPGDGTGRGARAPGEQGELDVRMEEGKGGVKGRRPQRGVLR
jgi:hypothetical protein